MSGDSDTSSSPISRGKLDFVFRLNSLYISMIKTISGTRPSNNNNKNSKKMNDNENNGNGDGGDDDEGGWDNEDVEFEDISPSPTADDEYNLDLIQVRNGTR